MITSRYHIVRFALFELEKVVVSNCEKYCKMAEITRKE